jgi:hypothetical protein
MQISPGTDGRNSEVNTNIQTRAGDSHLPLNRENRTEVLYDSLILNVITPFQMEAMRNPKSL